MKICSFKVAKALKDAGYPLQRFHTVSREQFEQGWGPGIYGESLSILYPEDNDFVDMYFCPTYIDVWLWLWREKEIQIELETEDDNSANANIILSTGHIIRYTHTSYINKKGPEEAIAAAIEYLVDNDLIK